MMPDIRPIVFSLLFLTLHSFAQQDTTGRQGTITVMKKKDVSKLFVSSEVEFDIRGNDRFVPFPVVDDYPFPFNYSRYFQERFREVKKQVNFKGADTVYLEITISKKGKMEVKDLSSKMKRGNPVYLSSGSESKNSSELALLTMSFLYEIKKWFPAYEIDTEVDRFKGQTVIKPTKKNLDSKGLLRIYFSSEPFD
jgi:hypothetical protein